MVNVTTWVKVNLFLSSYLPLWIILLIMHLYKNQIFQIGSDWSSLVITGILIFVSVYPVWRVQRYMKETLTKNSKDNITIVSTEDMTSEYLLYVVTYVFPFMTAQSYDAFGTIALIGALTIIAILYIRANLFHVNPTLLLLYNYRLYKVVESLGNTRHIFSKQESILRNERMSVSSFHGILYIQRQDEPVDITKTSEA